VAVLRVRDDLLAELCLRNGVKQLILIMMAYEILWMLFRIYLVSKSLRSSSSAYVYSASF
jgi:hypothetical protein